MFCWTEEMVHFMRDASRAGDYHRQLAAILKARLDGAQHVCDAGCGLGFLSCRMAEQFPYVTAADVSETALDVLRAQARQLQLSNLTVLQADLTQYTPPEPFDAMVFCFYGRMREILHIAKRCCRGRIAVIKKDYTHHRFSVSHVPLRDETADQAAQLLRERDIPFALEKFQFEMGQPFRSLEDAVRFFEIYSKDAPGALTQDAVRQRLRETGDAEFPYYLPQEKKLGLLTLDTKDIPEREDLI